MPREPPADPIGCSVSPACSAPDAHSVDILAFAVERRPGDNLTNGLDQFVIAAGGFRALALRHRGLPGIVDRPGQPPVRKHTSPPTGAAGGGRLGLAARSRPPTQRRVRILQLPDALAQQFIVHGEVGDVGLQAPALVIGEVLVTDLQAGLAAGEEGVASSREGGGGDGILAVEGFQIGAVEQFEDDNHFALG